MDAFATARAFPGSMCDFVFYYVASITCSLWTWMYKSMHGLVTAMRRGCR